MNLGFSLACNHQNWQALSCRALFWVEENALLLSDIHLGRVAHLRKHGFALNPSAQQQDFDHLENIVAQKQYKTIYVLGDLFHSKTLADGDLLAHIIKKSGASWVLVKGNHDVFEDETYLSLGFTSVESDLLVSGNILLKHEPSKEDLKSHFCISGHLHPGYQIKGMAKQSLILPCFYFSNNQIILPAIGQLTGLHRLKKVSKSDTVVVCTEKGVYCVM